MKPFTLSVPKQQFRGIDRRVAGTAADPDSCHDALNLDLTLAGRLRRRPGVSKFIELPPGTFGLYPRDGVLRVVAPAGNGADSFSHPSLGIDVIGDSVSEPTDPGRYIAVTSRTSWGVGGNGSMPYLVLKTAGGQYAHHWIRAAPASPGAPVSTLIATGFDAGPHVAKIQEKLYATDRINRVVRFCSTQYGPWVWDETLAPADAGFIDPKKHALAGMDPQGLTIHQGKLVIVYENAMQLWTVDPDPGNHVFVGALNGPGTRFFGTLSPVIGDLFYFSEGGFRSLATQTVTGELREGDIGSAIQALTAALEQVDPAGPQSLWVQSTSQYLAFFPRDGGTDVFAFTWSQQAGVMGWTRWVLSKQVSAVCEQNGVVYFREGDVVYKLDPESGHDHDDTCQDEFESVFESQLVNAGIPAFRKLWTSVDVAAEGVYDLAFADGRNRDYLDVDLDIGGDTFDALGLPLSHVANAIAVRVAAREAIELDRIDLNGSILMTAP